MNTYLQRAIERSAFRPTYKELQLDWMKFKARRRTRRMLRRYTRTSDLPPKLHFGCGGRRVDGWLNVDLVDSDIDLDFSQGKLPFQSGTFSFILSQHVIEHLEMERELLPMLREFSRVLRRAGEVWLSCPCIEKICRAYLQDGAQSLVEGRQTRFPKYSTGDYPAVSIVNHLFHQRGEHKNLFDFGLLRHVLNSSGFSTVERVDERLLLETFPEFPSRNDEEQTLYVRARK